MDSTEPKLNQADYDQYDRQIHIWGAENQKKLIASNIAFVYCDSLCVEVAKNIVLAGMNITLCDDAIVNDEEYQYNYFLRKEDTGKQRCECVQKQLQELNPRATINAIHTNEIDFNSVSASIFCNPSYSQLEWISSLESSSPLFCIWSTDKWGILMNAQSHQPLSQFLKVYSDSQPESILPELIKDLNNNQIPVQSPIAIQAIIGGIISQTLVSVVTGQGVLKDSIEFDATTLNVTEFSYYLV